KNYRVTPTSVQRINQVVYIEGATHFVKIAPRRIARRHDNARTLVSHFDTAATFSWNLSPPAAMLARRMQARFNARSRHVSLSTNDFLQFVIHQIFPPPRHLLHREETSNEVGPYAKPFPCPRRCLNACFGGPGRRHCHQQRRGRRRGSAGPSID